MVDATTVQRISALAGAYKIGKSGILGTDGMPKVVLEEVGNLSLWQIATWRDSMAAMEQILINSTGITAAPAPCTAAAGGNGNVLRIEPMKWWLVGAAAPELDPHQGATLDLSHSRTQIRVSGPNAVDFLNRFLPLDFRPQSFSENTVASSVIHHVGVAIWRSEKGYELFIPRGFALSLWAVFIEVAEQFGVEVR